MVGSSMPGSGIERNVFGGGGVIVEGGAEGASEGGEGFSFALLLWDLDRLCERVIVDLLGCVASFWRKARWLSALKGRWWNMLRDVYV